MVVPYSGNSGNIALELPYSGIDCMRTTSLITLLLLMISGVLSAQNQRDLEAIQTLFAASVNEQWKGPYGCYAK